LEKGHFFLWGLPKREERPPSSFKGAISIFINTGGLLGCRGGLTQDLGIYWEGRRPSIEEMDLGLDLSLWIH